MSFILTKSFTFEASHQLPHHDGKCRRLHGHSWKGTVTVRGDSPIASGPKSGMIVDYYDLSQVINPLVEVCLDHHHLNETTGLENPTCEELSRWIFNQLKPLIPQLVAVEIAETCTSSCRYQPSAM